MAIELCFVDDIKAVPNKELDTCKVIHCDVKNQFGMAGVVEDLSEEKMA